MQPKDAGGTRYGKVEVEVELENYEDRVLASWGLLGESEVYREIVRVLAHSRSVMLVLPQDLVEALGLPVVRRLIVTYADERRGERNVAGVMTVRVAGGNVQTSCVVGPPGSEPLLGQLILEEADLLVDAANGRLVPRPESPYLPMLKLK